MSNISRSPERHTFQKEGYIKRQIEKGEPINEDYLDFFEEILKQDKQKFDDPEQRKNNLEYDLLTTDWILEKVRNDDSYAQNLYAALCNSSWRSKELWPTLKEQNWSCSWRYAGGIIADMQQKGDYIDWYCSGIRHEDGTEQDKYVPEGFVAKKIEDDLDKLGWVLVEYDQREE